MYLTYLTLLCTRLRLVAVRYLIEGELRYLGTLAELYELWESYLNRVATVI